MVFFPLERKPMAQQFVDLGLDTVSELSSVASAYTPSSSCDRYFPRTPSTVSTASTSRKSIVRRSFGVLEGLPKEFSSLVRSHSISRHFSSQLQACTSFTEGPPADDSKTGMNGIQLRPSLDVKIPCSHAEDERPSRRTKLESRIYNFLTRSRSRSRSKLDAEDFNSPPSRPSKPRESMQREAGGQRSKAEPAAKPPNGAKPASRIPSRPLSATTSTNSTLTPLTPKPRKQASHNPPAHLPSSAQIRENPLPPPRSTTPKQSTTKKLQNLFGIPLVLRRSSRSRSRSRPNSPQPSLNVPPLPSADHDGDPTPKPRKSTTNSPLPSRPASPTPNPKAKHSPSHPPSSALPSTSLRLPRLFAGRTTTTNISGANALQPRPSNAAATGSLKSGGATVSAALKRPSHRRTESKPDPPGSPSAPASRLAISTGKPHTSLKSSSQLSQLSTPLKSLAPVPLQLSRGRTESHHAPKNASMDAGYRYRGGNMSIVDEEGRNSAEMANATSAMKGKARETDAHSHLRMGGGKMSAAVRSTKHGSFDFERPGWGAAMMQRTGSNGTTTTMTSSHSKDLERDSAFGPGLAGVGTLQRDVSLKRAKNTEEQIKARERAKRLHEHIQKDKLPSAMVNGQGSSSNHSDQVNASTSTNGTAQTGKSSSMSKATGKRFLAVSRAGGSGVNRLIGTAQHGLFSFEPPVPSPTRSTGSNGTAHEGQSYGGRGEHGAEPLKEKSKDRKNAMKGDRPPVPVPSPSSIPQRPGHRGRSLDLGIGLAWAPSKMKETALLPSTTLFSRSTSNSSSIGRSASGSAMARSASSSTNGHDSSRSRRIHIQDSSPDAERSKLGKEVAELFRNVLDDHSYNAFKTYVRQFDAHEIPFDGPSGIVERVERLLENAPGLRQDNRVLLDKFVRIILQTA